MEKIYDGTLGDPVFQEVSARIDIHSARSLKRDDLDRQAVVAKELGISLRRLRTIARRLLKSRRHEIHLSGNGCRIPIANVITDKGFERACSIVMRTYAGTLKNLELPGYALTDGVRSEALELFIRTKKGKH